MTDLDVNLVIDVWSIFSRELPEKSKVEAAREFLITLEDYEAITYNTMMELKDLDDSLKSAVQELYKEDDEEIIEDDSYDEETY